MWFHRYRTQGERGPLLVHAGVCHAGEGGGRQVPWCPPYKRARPPHTPCPKRSQAIGVYRYSGAYSLQRSFFCWIFHRPGWRCSVLFVAPRSSLPPNVEMRYTANALCAQARMRSHVTVFVFQLPPSASVAACSQRLPDKVFPPPTKCSNQALCSAARSVWGVGGSKGKEKLGL